MKAKLIFSVLYVCWVAEAFAQKELVFATYAYSSNNRIQNLEPLAKWLSAETGLSIKAVSYPSVKSLIRAIQHDSVDFAMMNTSGYLVLARNYPNKAAPLVNLSMGTQQTTNYGGCIIASRTQGITSLKGISANQKLTLALVASSSTSGNLVPRLLLNEEGIANAEDRFSVYYAGTHALVVADVLQGKSELGGCGCAEVEKVRQQPEFNERAVVIGSFKDIPLGPVVYLNSISKPVRNQMKAALQRVHQSAPEVFKQFCGGWTEFIESTHFKPVADKDYNSFRKMFGGNNDLWLLIE
jgi:phosphonate transport system substrate-binding protein